MHMNLIPPRREWWRCRIPSDGIEFFMMDVQKHEVYRGIVSKHASGLSMRSDVFGSLHDELRIRNIFVELESVPVPFYETR